MNRLTLSLLSILLCAPALANQGPFYAVQDDVDVIIGPIAVYSADGTTLATYDFNTAGLVITCMSPQSATTHQFTQAAAEIDDEASHTTHGDPAAGQIGLDVDATGLSFLHFTDDLWSVTDWRYYGCHMTDGGTALMDTDFMIWRVEDSADVAVDVRTEMDANSTQLAAIVGDTGELQTDWTDGGRLDLILDARASQASVDTAQADLDLQVDGLLKCEVNTAFFAATASQFACILTDADDAAVTTGIATNDLAGRLIEFTSGNQNFERRFVNGDDGSGNRTVWDATNEELQIFLDRALPAAPADGDFAVLP